MAKRFVLPRPLADRLLRRRLRRRPLQDFDLAFYAKRYGDLAGLDELALTRHWLRHGRAEGRAGRPEALIRGLEAEHGALPDDFRPEIYRALYADIAVRHQDLWESTAHYIEFGRPEERPYRVETGRLAEDFRGLLLDEAGGAPVPEDAFERFLAGNGLPPGVWLARFDLAEFTLLNADWLARPPASKAEGVRLFVERGIARLAPIATRLAFDPAFTRAHYGLEGDDAALYRDWLGAGLHAGREPNEAAFLLALIGSERFPEAFDEAAYRASLPAEALPRPGRLAALEHAIDLGVAGGLNPFPLEAARLHEVAADYHLFRGRYAIALAAYDRAVAAAPEDGRVREKRGGARLTVGDAAGAASDLDAASSLVGATAEAALLGARAHLEAGDPGAALALLRRTAARDAQNFAWRRAGVAAIDALFAAGSEAARALYASGRRVEADAAMARMLDEVTGAWPDLAPMPVALPPAGRGRIAMLANLDLPQCVHYRVEQRRRQLEAGGWTVTIHGGGDADAFREALHGADAALFYRVPAFPAVIRAILYARALGLPTFYDIDDLIFDAAVYPEPFARFEGAITPDEYVGLQYGVPLFRHALALCDAAIASTPALAERMAPLTRTGRAHVVRNGLDQRNARFLTGAPKGPGETVTILYGSGTKAHNRDFAELAAPALLDVLAAHPSVRLLVVGHLPADPRFEPHHARIARLGFTADVDAYWDALSAADINLAVLAPGAAADAKSEIKWLEAAMSAIPSIVSPTRTYREVLVDGEDALFAETPEDWHRALDRLVADPGLRARIGAAARHKALASYGLESGVAALGRALPRPSASAPAVPRKLRLLVVNVFFPPQTIGGATRVVRDNVDHLLDHAGNRFEIAAAASDEWALPAGASRVDSYRGLPVFRIATPLAPGMDWRPYDPETGAVFDGVLERFAPDLVHFHCVQRLSASVVDAARARRIPHLVTVHDGWWLSDYQFLLDGDGLARPPSGDPLRGRPPPGIDRLASLARRRRLAATLGGANRVVAVSETFAALYRAAGIAGTIAVPNGVPPLVPAPRVPNPDGRVRLGHLGGRSTHKGATLVEAVLRAGRFARLHLTIVDLAYGPEYRRDEVWGATPVTVIGRRPEAAMPALYAGLDVLLAPSLWPESFGLVAREARSLGLWVVASDRGAMAEDVTEGEDGFVIDVATPAPLAAVLAALDADPARFTRSPPPGRPARTAADQGADLIDLYAAILGSAAPREAWARRAP